MDDLKYSGKLRAYLRAPLYMTVVFAAADVFLYIADRKAGVIAAALTLVYLIVVTILALNFRRGLNDEIISFATHYGTVQKELLEHFQIPYLLLDEKGRIVWMNREFRELADVGKNYRKEISGILPEITRELLRGLDREKRTVRIEYRDRIYRAELERLDFGDEVEFGAENDHITLEHDVNTLTAVLLFDVTELEAVKRENADQKLVPAIIYIDNFDETVNKVEIVKRSLLAAVIDRKINQYFQSIDGIVQKIEKDKYFVVFQHRFLAKLEESKFSILDDIRGIHVGNETEVTLSIGIGLGAPTYTETLEYARAAINIALGRGGSQAVVKNGQNVSYYGAHGREIERNTRVKARVKAQALREMMESRDNVIVMGHAISDIDAFGAAVGVCCAARELGKKAQIVLNTITASLRPLVNLIMAQKDTPEDLIVNSEGAMRALTNRTLVMVVDTNRANYTECPELLTRSSSIVVFDHHRQGDGQIQNPVLSYIEPYASSTCEMIAEVLQYFTENIRIRPYEADCIYAGILIDTNNFMAKTGVRTFEAAAYLRRSGADMTRVRKMLRENMTSYKARAEVVRDAEVYRGAFAISICSPEGLESPTIVAAQAANELLDIVGIKASFVMTEYQKKVFVSARSIDEIDVQMIMERLGGGGHLNVAGAQIEGVTMEDVRQRIKDILDTMIEEGEIVI